LGQGIPAITLSVHLDHFDLMIASPGGKPSGIERSDGFPTMERWTCCRYEHSIRRIQPGHRSWIFGCIAFVILSREVAACITSAWLMAVFVGSAWMVVTALIAKASRARVMILRISRPRQKMPIVAETSGFCVLAQDMARSETEQAAALDVFC